MHGQQIIKYKFVVGYIATVATSLYIGRFNALHHRLQLRNT